MSLRTWLSLGLLLGVLVFALLRALVDDETRIRDLIAGAAAAFDARDSKGCLEPFDDRYACESVPELDRRVLAGWLAYAFRTRIDRQQQFLLRVRLDPEAIAVDVSPGEPKVAEARFRLALDERNGEEWAARWAIDVVAKLESTGAGWRIRSSKHTTVEGRMPSAWRPR